MHAVVSVIKQFSQSKCKCQDNMLQYHHVGYNMAIVAKI